MANTTRLSQGLTVRNAITGQSIDISKWYQLTQVVNPADEGILSFVKPAAALDANTFRGAKPFTLTSNVRHDKRFVNTFPESGDQQSGLFASGTRTSKVFVGKTWFPLIVQDQVIIDMFDETNIAHTVQGELEGQFSGIRKLIRNHLLTEMKSDLNTYELFSTEGALTRTPQPAKSTTKTFAEFLSDVKKGIRIPVGLSSATWNSGTNRVDAIRAIIVQLNTIGTERSSEVSYPFAYDGVNNQDFRIITTYDGQTRLKADGITQLINPRTGIEQRYPSIDGIPIIIDNLLPKDVEYAIVHKDFFFKNSNTIAELNVVAEITNATTTVLEDGTVKNLRVHQKLMRMNNNVYAGIEKTGLAWIIPVDNE